MRQIKNIIGLAAAVLILQAAGCKSDNSLTEEQIRAAKLAREWEPANDNFVTLDGMDASTYFQGFTLVINEKKNFVTTHGNDPVWPVSGTLEFERPNGSLDLTRLVRSDGVVISIVALSETSLSIAFSYDHTVMGGRKAAVSGQYHFELSAK